MIKPTSRKTVVSKTNNMEVCDHHVQHRLGTYKCTLYTNLPLEGKAGSFNNATWDSRIATKDQNLMPGKRFT